jgi:hypothetical protein
MAASTDPYGDIKRMTTVLGDIRTELIKEGFSSEEAFALIITMIEGGAIQ